MVFKFTCKELGRNCNYIIKSNNLKELIIKAIIHEILAHNVEWQQVNQNVEEMKLVAAIKQVK
jgi:predicted small metal-binding protein